MSINFHGTKSITLSIIIFTNPKTQNPPNFNIKSITQWARKEIRAEK